MPDQNTGLTSYSQDWGRLGSEERTQKKGIYTCIYLSPIMHLLVGTGSLHLSRSLGSGKFTDCQKVILIRKTNLSFYLKLLTRGPWNGTWIPFTQGFFVPSSVEIGPVVLEKISKFCQCIFRYFVMISPWKRAGPFVWKNLNTLYPTILFAKFNWNWPSGSGEADF